MRERPSVSFGFPGHACSCYTRSFVNFRLLFFPAIVLLLSSCTQMPDAYAPPVQRKPIEDATPYRVSRVINMNDPDAASHIVKDIDGGVQGGSWRWAFQRPTIQVILRSTENQKFVIDFAIAQVTFKDTGPVTLSYSVNGHLLDKVRYTTSGEKHFEKPVPSQWLKQDMTTLVSAEIDKLWTAPQDGAKMGFILIRMGLTQ